MIQATFRTANPKRGRHPNVYSFGDFALFPKILKYMDSFAIRGSAIQDEVQMHMRRSIASPERLYFKSGIEAELTVRMILMIYRKK